MAARVVHSHREPGDDAIHVTVEVGIGPNGDTVAVDKGSNRLRDVFFRRHRRTANEERHDRTLPGQRGLDLDPHKVSGIFEPRGVALRIQPTGPDDGQKDIALTHHPTEIFAEIDTQRDRIQILQNLLATIVHHEPIENPARDISGILASVTDECLGHQLAFVSYRPAIADHPYPSRPGSAGLPWAKEGARSPSNVSPAKTAPWRRPIGIR